MAESKLEGQYEDILLLIVDGKTFRYIANKYRCSVDTVHRYLNRPEHSARTREALELSAASYADKAEDVLVEAEASKEELMRARELSQLYRWKAAKRAPAVYGDKVDINHGGQPANPIKSEHRFIIEDMTDGKTTILNANKNQ